MGLPSPKSKPSVDGLSLVIPTAHAKPDYIVLGDHHRISIRATVWFKVRAALSMDWAIERIRAFAEINGMKGEPILTIVDRDRQPLHTKK